ncbi:hypothetical protein [Sphingomonas crocodyli]|uniref:hypothetical protein n=1 Tax=Sphingomonas crocodyli TaxID=1979270 RepID=UPI000FDA740F|nr:hypothetical protein [Sphingomonas crocodyli]
MPMTVLDKIDYFERRARQEHEAAATAACAEARRAHASLAHSHEQAAARERLLAARLQYHNRRKGEDVVQSVRAGRPG